MSSWAHIPGAESFRSASTSATPSPSTPSPSPAASPSKPLSKEQHQLALLLSASPRSLEFDRGLDEPPPALRGGMGQAFLGMLGFYSKKSGLLHGGLRLYDAIKVQVDAGSLQRAFGLDPKTFFSTYALMALHMWMCFQRLAKAQEAGAISASDAAFVRQRFFGQFNADVDFRVHRAGVEVGAKKWLKQLEQMFYSMSINLDKALRGEGDESVVDVLLIECYGGDTEFRPHAAMLARHLQRELACLQLTPHEAVLKGHVRFSLDPFRHIASTLEPARAAAAAGAAQADVLK